MALTALFVDDSAVEADLHSLALVTLLGRHEFDAAVAVPVVVPIDERDHPLTSLLSPGFWKVVTPVISTPGGLRT